MPASFPLDEIRSRIGKWKSELLQRKGTLFRLLAVELQTLAAGSFWTLSQGETDSDRGITWEPLKPSYVDWKEDQGYSTSIGVRTGRMRAIRSESNRFITTDGFFVTYLTDYAKHFDRRRELLPPEDRIPEKWMRRLNDSVVEYADEYLQFPGERET